MEKEKQLYLILRLEIRQPVVAVATHNIWIIPVEAQPSQVSWV